MQKEHATIEAPETVAMFLKFMNSAGPVVSRDWVYRKLKDKSLPYLKVGRKILVVRSQILARMEEMGEK